MEVSPPGQLARIGVHTFVWSATTTDAILDVIPRAAALGYSGIEIPILAPGTLDTTRIRAALHDHALTCTTSSALPPGLSLIDVSVQSATLEWIEQVMGDVQALDASILCGPLLTPIGEMRGRGRTQEEWANAVHALRRLGDQIEGTGITVALEPLNRFESFVVNTIADGVQMIEEIDRHSIGLLLDTFHMNIEESGIPEAISSAAGHIAHFHISENHRGSLGTGHIPWDAVLDALSTHAYTGWMVVESFGSALPELAAAASIWRPVASSADALAAESMEFLADHVGRHRAANEFSAQ